MSAIDTVKKLAECFQNLDPEALEALMTDDVVNYITTIDGNVNRLVGPKAYADNFRAMIQNKDIEIRIDLIEMIETKPGLVLLLLGGKVLKDGQEIFHNIGGYLINVNAEGKITESWKVDAAPKGSHAFWKGE